MMLLGSKRGLRKAINWSDPLARGLLLEVSPSLGIDAGTTQDLSPGGRSGTNTGGQVGLATRGIGWESTNIDDEIGFGDSSFLPLYSSIGWGFTAMIALEQTDTTARNCGVMGVTTTTLAALCSLVEFSGALNFDFGGVTGNNRLTYSASLSSGVWIITVGDRGSEIWLNGEVVAANRAAAGITRSSTTDPWAIGNVFSGFTDKCDLAVYTAHAVWQRQLTTVEAMRISRDPWALYRTPADDAIDVAAAAAGNRRRRILICGAA